MTDCRNQLLKLVAQWPDRETGRRAPETRHRSSGQPELDLERLVWDPDYRDETRAHWRLAS
jgi:hypothetical protein